jgi:hypothetical protein
MLEGAAGSASLFRKARNRNKQTLESADMCTHVLISVVVLAVGGFLDA